MLQVRVCLCVVSGLQPLRDGVPRCYADLVSLSGTLVQASNILLMGCNCVEGEGLGLIIATGRQNQLSKIAGSASAEEHPTSLQVHATCPSRYQIALELPTLTLACQPRGR